MEFKHKPVLLEECIEGLNIKPNGIYVDGTLGGAGHSSEIVKKLNKNGMLIGIDRDEEALSAAKKRLSEYSNVKYVHGNHDNIEEILKQFEIEKVDGILLDLGVSSYQLDERNRGFSYLGENELDMRMDKTQSLTAKDVVNTYSEEDDDYNDLVDKILKVYETISISWMEEFTITDSDLYEFVVFDDEDYTFDLIQNDAEAYDENLDTCVERAMSTAHERYEEMRSSIENDVVFLRDQIEKVVQFLDRVHGRTLDYANKWIAQKVDNT